MILLLYLVEYRLLVAMKKITTSKVNGKQTMYVIIASITILSITVIYLMPSFSNSIATGSVMITDRPLAETTPIIKIKSVSIAETRSANPDIELQPRADNFGVSFVALNRGTTDARVTVDKWQSSIVGTAWGATPEVTENNVSITIPAGGSAPIKRIDFSKYTDAFELFPGNYRVELIGFKWGEWQFDICEGAKCESFTKSGNFEEYAVRADLTIDYDTDLIKSRLGVLKADGMQMSVEGTGNPFTINNDAPKKVAFYIFNNKGTKISSLVSDTEFTIWNSEYRTKGDGATGFYDYATNQCEFLNPGEKKLVGYYDFSKSAWPIAKNGIAEKLGSQSAVPGIYIAYLQASTLPCGLENGEKFEGSVSTIIAAFEVVP